MRRISIIGMGPGGPEYLTVQAVETLKGIDVFFVFEKQGAGKEALSDARRLILETYRPSADYRVVAAPSPPRRQADEDYLDVVADWHSRKAAMWEKLIADHVAQEEAAGVLVWGDPSLYDSSVSILTRLQDKGRIKFDLEVIPGVTSLQVLAARHAIPLHEIGGELLVTTARRLRSGAVAAHDNVAVMLDSNAAFTEIDSNSLDIYWGAYLGSKNEILMSGPLEKVGTALAETVAHEKQRKGWILDIYLLRRRRAQHDDKRAFGSE